MIGDQLEQVYGGVARRRGKMARCGGATVRRGTQCTGEGMQSARPCEGRAMQEAIFLWCCSSTFLLQLLPISLILSSEADVQLLQLPHAFQADPLIL